MPAWMNKEFLGKFRPTEGGSEDLRLGRNTDQLSKQSGIRKVKGLIELYLAKGIKANTKASESAKRKTSPSPEGNRRCGYLGYGEG